MAYLIIAIIAIGGLFYFFSNSKRSKVTPEGVVSKTQQPDTTKHDKDNPYHGLRSMALNITPDQLQLTLPDNQTKVYGVVMDWDLGKGIATLISFSTGDASMYLSTGGGMIGAGHHQNISNAAKAFVDKAQNYLDKTTKTETTPLPEKNSVRFYLLTNKGKFSAQENLEKFEDNSSTWVMLFEEGNKVISELRAFNEKQ